MEKAAQQFFEMGEYFASGLMELPNAGIAQRMCRAYRRYYENCPMTYVQGSPLYPSGKINHGDMAICPQYSVQYWVLPEKLEKKFQEAGNPQLQETWQEFHRVHGWGDSWDGGWNHSALNYKRILREGVNGYEQRVRNLKDSDFRTALMDVLAGIRTYHSRALEYLKSIGADEKLIQALEKVPFEPAQSAYEALVSCNFMLFLDGCDNIGRVDSWLYPYWKGEHLVEIMHRMLKNVQDNQMWSITLGPDYNELTKQFLEASEGLARPMVELRVTDDMPEDLWNLAIKRVLTGGGQPSFYNETVIQKRLAERLPEAPQQDLLEFGGVGCTETCFGGMTYSGGIDCNLNVLRILENHMKESLASCKTFQEFYDAFLVRVKEGQRGIVRQLNDIYNNRFHYSFAPIRTLFIDDCIDRETGYHQGGARYSFAVPSESGIPNCMDSLLAIRELVYEKKQYTASGFLKALEKQDPRFKARLLQCPCYGVGNAEADALTEAFTREFYAFYRDKTLELGFGIFPTSHQFKRHVIEGECVGPTPDGRKAGQSVADSIAAVNGKAMQGPTGMLRSAAYYVQDQIYGMPVLNLSISKAYEPEVLKALIKTYFSMGGTQIQITCTTKEKLLAARENPDAHRDLIVRVGGYSDFFYNLTDGLKDAVVARTLFET